MSNKVTHINRTGVWTAAIKRAEEIDAEIKSLKDGIKALTGNKTSLYDELESNGIDHGAFKAVMKLRARDAAERNHYLESLAEGQRALGWTQVDAFDADLAGTGPDDDPTEPGEELESRLAEA
jgi:uncharacterized protein (UPF0335 family)